MADEVGRVTFETNIRQVRDEIVQGLAGISAALEQESSKGGGNPAGLAESQVAAQLARLRDAARQEIEQIKREFAAEAQRSAATGTPFVNPDSTGRGRQAGEQIQGVLTETSKTMQSLLTEFPESIRNATGDFRSLAQREVTSMLRELEGVFTAVNSELKNLATKAGSGFPVEAIGSGTTRAASRAERSLEKDIPYSAAAQGIITDPAALQAALAKQQEVMEARVAATERAMRAEEDFTVAEERLTLSVADAARRVESNPEQYGRTSKGEQAPFKITDPEFTQPGQSPFFRVEPPRPPSKDDPGDEGGLRRITALERVQQLETETLTTANERKRALYIEEGNIISQYLSGQQAHYAEQKAIYDQYLGGQSAYYTEQKALYDQIYEEQQRNIANQRVAAEDAKALHEQTLGGTLSAQRTAGTANPLGGNLFQLEDGTFVKRNGEAARELTGLGELADAELQLAEKLRRRQLAEDKRRAEIDDKPQGVTQGFIGGFTSRGFDSNGSNSQTFAQDITNLSATAGVLAKYSLAGEAIKLGSAALSELRTGTVTYTEEVEKLNGFLERFNETLGESGHATIDLAQAQSTGLSVALDLNSSIIAGSTGLAAYQDEVRKGADANQVFNDTILAVGANVLLTGQKADVAAKQLISVTQAYGTGSGGLNQVNDAIVNAQRNFGGDRGQISQAVGASAQLASSGGISEEELANMAALINARSTQTGAQIATTIERLVSRSQNKQFTAALQSQGIENTGNVSQELQQLSAAYQKLDRPGKEVLATQLGSSRALTGLLPLLRGATELQEANRKSLEGAGATQEVVNKHLDTFAGQLESLGATAKTLLTDIGTSGIFAPLGLALEALGPPLRIVTESMNAFDRVLSPLGRNIGGLVLDLGLGVVAFRRFQAAGIQSSATGLAVGKANQAQAASAAAATTAQTALADATAASVAADEAAVAAQDALVLAALDARNAYGLQTVAQEADLVATDALSASLDAQVIALEAQALAAGTAAEAIGTLIVAQNAAAASGGAAAVEGTAAGGLAARRTAPGFIAGGGAATAGLIVGALALTALGEKGYHLHKALDDAGSSMDKITHGNVEELQASIARLAVARANLNHESGGILGGLANALDGNPAAATRRELNAQIAELEAQAEAVKAAAGALGGGNDAAAFGPSGPATVQDLSNGIQALTASGAGANRVMAALITTIDGITGASQRAAHVIDPGSLVLPTGSAGLTQDVLKGLPGLDPRFSLYQANDLVQQTYDGDTLKNAGLNRFSKNYNNINQNIDQGAGDAFHIGGIDPTAAQSKAVRDAITGTLNGLGKGGQGAVLSPADLATVAHAAAQALNLKGKLADLEPLFEQALLAQLKNQATKPITSANIRKDPTILNAGIAQAITTAGQRTSDATARGADSTELLKVQQQNLKDLQHIADSVRSAGLNVHNFDNLEQGLKVAAKNLFDAFAARVKDMAASEEKALGNSAADQARKKAIEGQVAKILTAANKTDPNLLGSSFNNLDGAQTLLAQAALNQSAVAAQAAAALVAQAKKNAAALNAEADTMLRGAAAIRATHEDYSIASAVEREANQKRGEANRQTAAANAAAAAAKAPKLTLNDPSAQAGIDQTAAAATKPASASKSDTKATPAETAAQIEALRLAANVFPGDKVGEAAARVKGAAAELAAATGTRAADQKRYYTALKDLHTAQRDYADAILASQDQTRLLGIDRTNPLLVARDKVTAALAKLHSDSKAGAPKDIINADKIAVGDAQSAAERTAFDQRFQDAQTNDQLGRTSHQAYLNYLNNEHNRLTAIRHRTRQQQDELNQIDGALKSAADATAGQFNIGDIKIPTIYEVRRAVVARAGGVDYNGQKPGAGTAATTNHNQFTFTGLSKHEVLQVLKDALGASATQQYATTARKV